MMKEMKGFTEEAMRIEMAPWVKGYTVAMSELYTELTIEKVDNKAMGNEGQVLGDYKDLFIEKDLSSNAEQSPNIQEMVSNSPSKTKQNGKHILAKADPGFGKTTLSKKISYDWATGIFKSVSIVICIFLKLVRPGEALENIIIDQYPILQNLNVGPQKLKQVLESFGDKCLIIFDGLDEYDLRTNKDVLDIIEHRRLAHSNIILTSRSHCVSDILANFQTVVRIKGFTEDRTRKFVSHILKDKEKIETVVQFNSEKFVEEDSVHSSPMLLMFICILVNSSDITLQKETMSLGDIYTRLVRCLYRKFIARKGIEFQEDAFVDLLKRVGKIAWDTLQSGLGWFQSNEIFKIIGEDAFDTGLVLGHKDDRLFGDETADIFISFPHTTIQEFLGALYFMLTIDKKQSIQSFLDCEKAIFMTNPLFHHFCLYFVSKGQKYFKLQKGMVYKNLKLYLKEKVDLVQQDLYDLKLLFSGINITNNFGFDIVNEALALCEKTTEFNIGTGKIEENDLAKFLPHVKKLRLLIQEQVLGPFSSLTKQSSDDEFSIVIRHSESEYGDNSHIDELFSLGGMINKNPAFHILPTKSNINICKYVQKNVHKVFISGETSLKPKLTAELEEDEDDVIENCPFLSHLCLLHMIIDQGAGQALLKAVRKGRLKKLRHLTIANCTFKKFSLSKLFNTKWPPLTHLDLSSCHLDINDIKSIGYLTITGQEAKPLLSQLSTLAVTLDKISSKTEIQIVMNVFFQQTLVNLIHLGLYEICIELYREFVTKLDNGTLPNLKVLGLSVLGSEDLETIPISTPLPFLTDLKLTKNRWTELDLETIAQSQMTKQLGSLDISHSSGITGNLSVLLRHSFPSLNTLILSDCGLNSQDLCSLAQASVDGRLPQFRHLDISDNVDLIGKLGCLFIETCKWESLRSFNAMKLNSKSQNSFQLFADKIASGYMKSLQKMALSTAEGTNFFDIIMVPLTRLQKIEVECHPAHISDTLEPISQAVDKQLLPVLNTIIVHLASMPVPLEEIFSYTDDDFDNFDRGVLESITNSLGSKLSTLDFAQSEALINSLNPSIQEMVSQAFPDLDSKVHDEVTESITTLIVHVLSSQNETESEPDSDPDTTHDSESEMEDDSQTRSEAETESDAENDTGTNFFRIQKKNWKSVVSTAEKLMELDPDSHLEEDLRSLVQYVESNMTIPLGDELDKAQYQTIGKSVAIALRPVLMFEESETIRESAVLLVVLLVTSLHQSLTQRLSDIKQNPAASLNPSISERFSEAFPEVHPDLLKSISAKLAEQLPDILSTLLNDQEDQELFSPLMEDIIFPIFLASLGIQYNDKCKSLVCSIINDASDSVSGAQFQSVLWASDVKWKLRKQGIRIYFLHKPYSRFTFDDQMIFDDDKGSTSDAKVLVPEVKSLSPEKQEIIKKGIRSDNQINNVPLPEAHDSENVQMASEREVDVVKSSAEAKVSTPVFHKEDTIVSEARAINPDHPPKVPDPKSPNNVDQSRVSGVQSSKLDDRQEMLSEIASFGINVPSKLVKVKEYKFEYDDQGNISEVRVCKLNAQGKIAELKVLKIDS